MSGYATEAYAFLIQATNACLLLDGNHSGQTDIGYLARKLLDVYSDSRSEIGDLPAGRGTLDMPTLDVSLGKGDFGQASRMYASCVGRHPRLM
jgi:hypothetical protein